MPLTRKDLLTAAICKLHRSGVDAPRLSAEVLMARACGLSRLALLLDLSQDVQEDIQDRFKALVSRRASGEPIAYILGSREFYSRSFRVESGVLIPRPETELIVDLVLENYPRDSPICFVDLGTGSGVLAVTIASECHCAHGVGTDLSRQALLVAADNVRSYGLSGRIGLVHTDLGSGLRAGRFDVVVSNPPYLSEEELKQASREISDHEPRRALVAGPLGTELLVRVVDQAAILLRSKGRLFMEIGSVQGPGMLEYISRTQGQWQAVVIHRDLAGHDRVLVAHRC